MEEVPASKHYNFIEIYPMNKVKKNIFTDCKAPSSETCRVYLWKVLLSLK
jgi:hypothetical protein